MVKNFFGILFGRMSFDKNYYKKEFERLLDYNSERKFFIRFSNNSFKINKFIKKGNDSLMIAKFLMEYKNEGKDYWIITICYYSMLYLAKAAILERNYETDDHYSTQIALGHLLVPDKIEKEELEILEQTHKIFESEYVDYFENARKESSISKYSPSKVYSQRRVNEVFNNATNFIHKLNLFVT